MEEEEAKKNDEEKENAEQNEEGQGDNEVENDMGDETGENQGNENMNETEQNEMIGEDEQDEKVDEGEQNEMAGDDEQNEMANEDEQEMIGEDEQNEVADEEEQMKMISEDEQIAVAGQNDQNEFITDAIESGGTQYDMGTVEDTNYHTHKLHFSSSAPEKAKLSLKSERSTTSEKNGASSRSDEEPSFHTFGRVELSDCIGLVQRWIRFKCAVRLSRETAPTGNCIGLPFVDLCAHLLTWSKDAGASVNAADDLREPCASSHRIR